MFKRTLLLLLTVFSFNLSFSQTQPVKQVNTLLYEVSTDPWHGGDGFTWRNTQQKTVTQLSSPAVGTYQIYKFDNFMDLFDPYSFALSGDIRNEGFDPKNKTSKKDDLTDMNSTWTNNFMFPPIQGGSCSSDSSWEINYKSEGLVQFTLSINGKSSVLQVVKVVGKGYWTACGYSGTAVQIALYSKEKKILVSHEWVGLYNGTIKAGRKMTLKEITSTE